MTTAVARLLIRRLRQWQDVLWLACQAPAFLFGFVICLPQPTAVRSGPAPGHPERLVPELPPTDVERALWAQLRS